MDANFQVEILKRQYLQLIDPEELRIPPYEILRLPETQAYIYSIMFEDSKYRFEPPEHYKFRVLKKLVNELEVSVQDPDEDEISDDISACLAQYMIQPLPSASAAAQQKSYMTFTAPSPKLTAPQVTLLEAPRLLASSGTTGFRTWEAALYLGAFLFSPNGRQFVAGKNVIELGAGTGFASILCAKHLGAKRVLATDGSQEVISDLKANLLHNGLIEGDVIQTSILQWGHTLVSGVGDCREQGLSYELIIGADVTYDLQSISALVATLRCLFELYPNLKILISATVRNEQTLRTFLEACDTNDFTAEPLNIQLPKAQEQTGFFIPTTAPIQIFLIKSSLSKRAPFEA